MLNKKTLNALIILAVVVAIIYFGFAMSSLKSATKKQPINNNPTPTTTNAQKDTDDVFGLKAKVAGTKLYYSDKLGVGFTYVPKQVDAPFTATVTESGAKIYIYRDDQKAETGQSLEVFTKSATSTLTEAINEHFLKGYDSKDCFVKVQETNETRLSNYEAAVIAFPTGENTMEAWWKNSEKCPKDYSMTNGIQYFLMNKDVPGKFLFVRIGQYMLTSDGTPKTETNYFNWSHSIRIVK